MAPEAGGAGVAEVTAYLNGCFMPKVCPLCLLCLLPQLPCPMVACAAPHMHVR